MIRQSITHQNIMLILITGLPGTGKSYFARQLSDRLRGEYISSDQTRKKMDAMGKYLEEDKEKVYGHMEELAQSLIMEEKTVILDATFYKQKLRNRFITLALDHNIPFYVVWITAEEEIIRERLASRRTDSEADYQVYVEVSKEYEPPTPPYLKLISARDNLQYMLKEAEDYIRQVI